MQFKHAFGPGDITAVGIVPGRPYVLDEVTDFSISSHYDKVPVRRLGHRLPVGWATGAGTIAGTIVCAQMTQGALWKLRKHAGSVRTDGNEPIVDVSRGTARVDFHSAQVPLQLLPPFHLMFVHANQSGQMGIARLYNVTISDQGEVKGANNAFTEDTLQFQALHYEQIRLHRSLTAEQLGELAGQEVGFFNDPRRSEGLIDGLLNVTGGEDSLARYLLTESDQVSSRLESGSMTSIALADQGDVVYMDIDEHAQEPQRVAVREVDAGIVPDDPDRSVTIPITEKEDQTDLLVKGKHIALKSETEEQVVGSLPTDRTKTYLQIDGSTYNDLTGAEWMFVPLEVELSINSKEAAVTRSRVEVSEVLTRDTESMGEATVSGRLQGYSVYATLVNGPTEIEDGGIGPYVIPSGTAIGAAFDLVDPETGEPSGFKGKLTAGDEIIVWREATTFRA